MEPACPQCKNPFAWDDLKVLDVTGGVPEAGLPPAFDLLLECPNCRCRLNAFLAVEKFTALEPLE